MTPDLGRYGIWKRFDAATPELARELEDLGFGTLWIGGSPSGDLDVVERALDATSSLMIATGIVNIWKDDAATVAASFHRIDARHPGRFVLGIGTGHREQFGDRFTKPYSALVEYLDGLDEHRVPADRRLLAALGPRVLALAAERSLGAHPYLTTPAHTRLARDLLGATALLAPEHKVVLDADPVRARSLGRPQVRTPYLGLANYTNNLRRLGYADADLADGGSDRLIDDLVIHGDIAVVAARLNEHLASGADHVAIQLISAEGADPVEGYRRLAGELLG